MSACFGFIFLLLCFCLTKFLLPIFCVELNQIWFARQVKTHILIQTDRHRYSTHNIDKYAEPALFHWCIILIRLVHNQFKKRIADGTNDFRYMFNLALQIKVNLLSDKRKLKFWMRKEKVCNNGPCSLSSSRVKTAPRSFRLVPIFFGRVLQSSSVYFCLRFWGYQINRSWQRLKWTK